jgi:hypothetical protein
MGHSGKHPYLLHGENWKLLYLPPSDGLIHLPLLGTFFHLPHGRNFLRWRNVDHFWNKSMGHSRKDHTHPIQRKVLPSGRE